VAELADVYAPLQTGDSVAKNPRVLAEAEVLLSGWGASAMDGAFLAAAPTCGSFSTARDLSGAWRPRLSGIGASESRAPTLQMLFRSPSTSWRGSWSPSSATGTSTFRRGARRHYPDKVGSPAPTVAPWASSLLVWSAVWYANAYGPSTCVLWPTTPS
jgi:hypothetical protein